MSFDNDFRATREAKSTFDGNQINAHLYGYHLKQFAGSGGVRRNQQYPFLCEANSRQKRRYLSFGFTGVSTTSD